MSKKKEASAESGKYAYDGLDRLLHEKARLGILTSLLTHPEGLLFNELKELCSLTDGNLSRHLAVLAEAGLITIQKGYERRRPQTQCRLSGSGRERFLGYLEELERILRDAGAPAHVALAPRVRRDGGETLPHGWAPA